MRTRAVSWDTPWASGITLALVITALDMAATTRGAFPAGVVLHADRGTEVTSQKLAAYMRAVTGTVSMGQVGVCWDNAMAESFWATLKTEYYYRRAFTTGDHVCTGALAGSKTSTTAAAFTPASAADTHRRRTTPSGLDNSRINKPSTQLAHTPTECSSSQEA